MGFMSYMMKNGPGSPGSICKDFGKVYQIRKQEYPQADNIYIFQGILSERYPRMPRGKVDGLVSCTNGDFLLYIFMFALYQNKSTLIPGEDNWSMALDAVYDTARERFPQYVKIDRMDFDMFCKVAYSCMKYYL